MLAGDSLIGVFFSSRTRSSHVVNGDKLVALTCVLVFLQRSSTEGKILGITAIHLCDKQRVSPRYFCNLSQ